MRGRTARERSRHRHGATGLARIALALVGLASACRQREEPPTGPVPGIERDISATPAKVRSLPPGAAIQVDGTPTGKVTPAEVTIHAGRDNTIFVHREGFLAAARIVSPDLNQVLEIDFRLEPGAPVRVATEPPGARVRIGDLAVVAATPGTIEALAEGRHVLAIDREGYVPVEHGMAVKGLDPVDVSLKLLPAAYLNIVSEPAGADIRVDGRLTGALTPADRVPVAAGLRHRVQVRKTGHTSATRTVGALAAGASASVSVALEAVRVIELRARIRRLEADVKRWTSVRDRLDGESSSFVVARDARKELALKQRFEEAEERVQTLVEELDQARDELAAAGR